MLRLFTAIIFVYCSLDAHAQNSIKADSLATYNIVLKESRRLKAKLEKELYASDWYKEQYITFVVDTFRIGRFVRLWLEDHQTHGDWQWTLSYSVIEYTKVMKKLLATLRHTLEPEDATLLVTNQKLWEKYIESERRVNEMLTQGRYSGGGTIQGSIQANRNFEMVKQRVFDLYDYLIRIERE